MEPKWTHSYSVCSIRNSFDFLSIRNMQILCQYQTQSKFIDHNCELHEIALFARIYETYKWDMDGGPWARRCMWEREGRRGEMKQNDRYECVNK